MTIPIPTSQVCLEQGNDMCHCNHRWLLTLLLIFPVTVIKVDTFSLCSYTANSNTPLLLYAYTAIARSVLGVVLLVLVIIRALKQSFEIYKATKRWHVNQCIQQLVRDGILYFLMYVSFSFPFYFVPRRHVLSLSRTRVEANHMDAFHLETHFTTSYWGSGINLQ